MPYPLVPVPSTVFPNHATQVLSSCIHMLGVSVLAFCFARRSLNDDLLTLRGWASLSWAKLCVLLVFFDSWLFLFTSGFLIHGIGLNASLPSCATAIYVCICLYCLSKIFIYCFLAERVYIVWSAGTSVPRTQSHMYRLCALALAVYAVIFGIVMSGKIYFFQEDQSCMIGLKKFASVPLLTYDLFVNIFLTSLFVVPLWRHNLNKKFRAVSNRTFIAACVALTTSTINILILTLLHGQEAGWVCLASCGTDVTVNAAVICWVTVGASQRSEEPMSLPPLLMPLSFIRPISRNVTSPMQTVDNEPTVCHCRAGEGSTSIPVPPSLQRRGTSSSIQFRRLPHRTTPGTTPRVTEVQLGTTITESDTQSPDTSSDGWLTLSSLSPQPSPCGAESRERISESCKGSRGPDEDPLGWDYTQESSHQNDPPLSPPPPLHLNSVIRMSSREPRQTGPGSASPSDTNTPPVSPYSASSGHQPLL
ncbi:hypothetical protein SISNIDRAFT_86189 [Sistotremastrum niveocremeum HHB9708]|uniref:Transmembrane protein n=1 Tax=Sistotremastrum niveocremeum HHB9708 TaxID=1314777 RepID=A0A164UVF8_9AGAM|nr:hypothetical protein SISNIDRAFT_86189 [Sistotremastrum niveocremeum HHB9708]